MTPIGQVIEDYAEAGMCAVNVHWHKGAEHKSSGQFDLPAKMEGRRLGDEVQPGMRCNAEAALTAEQKKPYKWKYCTNMKVGETYEVHWPHSNQGHCNGDWTSKKNGRYQSPFYDGVFCHYDGEPGTPLSVGVQGQVFLVVNDEDHKMPNLIKGMNMDLAEDVAKYTGSTTGSSVNNEMCSAYGGITWHVDRKCHLLSASSFDEMCKEMLEMGMYSDVYPHGSRELVDPQWVTDKAMDRLAEEGPAKEEAADHGRRLAYGAPLQQGYQCNAVASLAAEQKKPYNWKYCTNMHVGETYEVHWPHSNQGHCNGDWTSKKNARYQSPFYDGVFCHYDGQPDTPLKVGVQGQVFLVVNDEDHKIPNLIKGMDATLAEDVAKYTGSTTGQTVNNEMCSVYGGITWHVDRKCHLLSASSFDDMCKDMLEMGMYSDVYPHGSRTLVDPKWVTDVPMDRRLAE